MIKELWRNAKYNIIYYSIPFILSVLLISKISLTLRFNDFITTFVYCIPYFIIFLFLIKQDFMLLRTIFMSISVLFEQSLIVRLNCYSIVKYSDARSGKTLTSTIEGLYTALALFDELKRKYRVMSRLVLLDEYKHDDIFMTRWREVKRSYEHWKSHPDRIPCLMSNYKIMFNGQKSQDLYREHFEQSMWSPSYCVWIADEIGRWIQLSESSINNKPYEICDTICWIGQFYEAHLIATEQRPTNIPIDIRDVVAIYEKITDFEIVGQPILLIRVLDFLESLIDRFDFSPFLVRRLDKLRKLAKKIGFFKFEFEQQGNITYATKGEINKRAQYNFLSMNFKYDSRCYYNLNLAKDLKDNNTATDNMLIANDSAFAKMIHKRYKDKKFNDNVKDLDKKVKLQKLKLDKMIVTNKIKEFKQKINNIKNS